MPELSAGSLRSLAAARSERSTESICTFETAEEQASESDSDSLSPSGLVKHSDLWFTDGSVILQAENTIYRVHISQLSRHSMFFRDLFTLPQGCPADVSHNDNDTNVLEGCPLIHLHDTAEDVSNLLTALYDGPYVSQLITEILPQSFAHYITTHHIDLQELWQQLSN